MYPELYAKSHAKLNNQSIVKYLGKGTYGEAYLTSNNTVLKVTKDHCETLAALKMIGKKHENVVDIYSVHKLPENLFLIEQEALDHNTDADRLYWELVSIADHSGLENITELVQQDESFINNVPDENLRSVLFQMKSAMKHLNDLGIEGDALDLQTDNMAFNDGHITVFDNRYDALTKTAAFEKIQKDYPEIFQNSSQDYTA